MARKTIVKRASKYWPRADRLDTAIHTLNEEEGVFTEPVMPHAAEKVIQGEEQERLQALQERVSELCDQMVSSETESELKAAFKEAFRSTQGMPLQKNVQAIYQENKSRLGVE